MFVYVATLTYYKHDSLQHILPLCTKKDQQLQGGEVLKGIFDAHRAQTTHRLNDDDLLPLPRSHAWCMVYGIW